MVIDLVLVTPLLILLQSVIIPLIVSRILRGALAEIEEQLANSKAEVRTVASVLDAKRAENEKQAKKHAHGTDAKCSSIPSSIAWLLRKSKRRTSNIELGQFRPSSGSPLADSSDEWLERAQTAQGARCAEQGTTCTSKETLAKPKKYQAAAANSEVPTKDGPSTTANPLAAKE